MVFKICSFLVSLYYIDEVSEENCQNMLINVSFWQYFANIS